MLSISKHRAVLSRRRDLQKPDLIEVLSAILRGEAQIVGGVLELAYYRAAGDGQAFPTRERYRVMLQIMSGDLG